MSNPSLLLLAGGRSREHAVSLSSARSVIEGLASSSLTCDVIILAQDGSWLTPSLSQKQLHQKEVRAGGLPIWEVLPYLKNYKTVFPLLHGTYGEDGKIQGLLESMHVTYIGSGVLASAVAMDKIITKELASAWQIPQLPYVLQCHPQQDIEAILHQLGAKGPWFVKPCNGGSSVGISKVTNAAKLPEALTLAYASDRRILIEQGLQDVRELEVAILGNDAPQASVVGEICCNGDFYDYENKYTEGRSHMVIPADIPEALSQRIQQLALTLYRGIDASGLCRIDFFYHPPSSQLYFNEINPLPGFTPFSMYPLLWQKTGVAYEELIQKLIDLAIEKQQQRLAISAL